MHVGLNASVVGVAGWRLTLPRLILTQRVLAADNHFRNQNTAGVELDNGRDRQLAYRADATSERASRRSRSPPAREAERRDDSRVRRRLAANRVSLVQLDDYSGDALLTGGYASARWTPFARLTIAPGIRADRWTLTDQSTTSPWFQAEWRATRHAEGARRRGRLPAVRRTSTRCSACRAGSALQPERAGQFDVGVEQRVGTTLRVSMTRLRSRRARHAAPAWRRNPRRRRPRRARIRDARSTRTGSRASPAASS